MKERMRKGIALILCLFMVMSSYVDINVEAATTTSDKITIRKFVSMMQEASGAPKKTLVKTGEFPNMSLYISNESAALIADRAAVYKNGSSYDKDLYEQVVNKKRISDIADATKAKRASIYRCYVKGIMVGKSNGSYTQNRSFNPKSKLLLSEAKQIATRIKTKSKRIKLSYDGQVTRSTNLPKNSSKYSYILASFPNSFYEAKFEYQLAKYSYQPKELVDYASPKKLNKMISGDLNIGQSFYGDDGDKLVKLIEKNLKTRFNYNYKTTNKKKWISQMASTYYDSSDMAKILKNFTKYADERKVVVKSSQISVEPSTAYWSSYTLYVRCHARIKVTAQTWETYNSGDQNAMVFSNCTYLKNLKKGVWYDFDFDVALSPTAYGQNFSDWTLTWVNDCLINAGK